MTCTWAGLLSNREVAASGVIGHRRSRGVMKHKGSRASQSSSVSPVHRLCTNQWPGAMPPSFKIQDSYDRVEYILPLVQRVCVISAVLCMRLHSTCTRGAIAPFICTVSMAHPAANAPPSLSTRESPPATSAVRPLPTRVQSSRPSRPKRLFSNAAPKMDALSSFSRTLSVP